MLKEIFEGGLGMLNQNTRMEVTANNIANANTVGFKEANVFIRNMIDARANFSNTPGDIEQNDPPIGSYYTMTPGAYRYTSNNLDLALEGHGFFVLEDAEGKQFLSRAGNFELSKDGYIITKDGKFLMGETGPINLSEHLYSEPFITQDDKQLDIKINEWGEIYVNDQEADRLLLADVSDYKWLQRVSKTSFIPSFEAQPFFLEQGEIGVRQGWIEDSNVNIVNEMVEMIEVQRMFEANSKVVHTNNETLDKAIALGKYY
jgi:flagellar basal-body rod protein FlgG